MGGIASAVKTMTKGTDTLTKVPKVRSIKDVTDKYKMMHSKVAIQGEVDSFKSSLDNPNLGLGIPNWYGTAKEKIGTGDLNPADFLEGVLRLRKGRAKPFLERTGTPSVDEALERGDAEIVMMHPTEYIVEATKIFNERDGGFTTFDKVREGRLQNKDTLEELSEKMFKGEKLDMPYLNHEGLGQEGIHRAISASWLGIEKIPVAVIRKKDKKLKEGKE